MCGCDCDVTTSATVIVRARGAIWLNPFATVLFSVCSAVTVECCILYTCCMDVFCFVLSRQKLCVGMVVCISWLHSYLCVWM